VGKSLEEYLSHQLGVISLFVQWVNRVSLFAGQLCVFFHDLLLFLVGLKSG